jgi:ADP-ribose pyrophosphatase
LGLRSLQPIDGLDLHGVRNLGGRAKQQRVAAFGQHRKRKLAGLREQGLAALSAAEPRDGSRRFSHAALQERLEIRERVRGAQLPEPPRREDAERGVLAAQGAAQCQRGVRATGAREGTGCRVPHLRDAMPDVRSHGGAQRLEPQEPGDAEGPRADFGARAAAQERFDQGRRLLGSCVSTLRRGGDGLEGAQHSLRLAALQVPADPLQIERLRRLRASNGRRHHHRRRHKQSQDEQMRPHAGYRSSPPCERRCTLGAPSQQGPRLLTDALLSKLPAIRLELVEDLSPPQPRGFLRLVRRRLVARYPDGSQSEPFEYDEVDRAALDAVVIAAHFQAQDGTWVYLRSAVRPPVAFRSTARSPVAEPALGGALWELPAGLVDPGEGPDRAAQRELVEELGFDLPLSAFRELGPSTFPAPGFVAERHFFFEVEVEPGQRDEPSLDGSPLEAFGVVVAVRLADALELCRTGVIEDAKTELVLRRLAERLA